MTARRFSSAHVLAVTIAVLIVVQATNLLSGHAATMVACIAILVFGLPHGTLDLELVKRERATGPARMTFVLVLYLGLAAAMYAIWETYPLAALCVFLGIAVVHFSEDWPDSSHEYGNAFLAQGMALALLTAPAFLHRPELKAHFVALSGDPAAGIVADVMMLLAPVSLAVAAVAILSFRQTGQRDRAIAAASALAGMILLPPAIGFAVFFCLFHSPRHLRAALDLLSRSRDRSYLCVVAPLTLAALGIAAWLFTREVRADLSSQLVAASFMTLSLLTVPHMAVPAILAFVVRLRSHVGQRVAGGSRSIGA